MTGHHSEEILHTIAGLSFHQQMQVVSLNGVLINSDLKPKGILFNKAQDHSFMPEQGPGSHSMMRLHREVVALFYFEWSLAASFIEGQASPVFFFRILEFE